MKTEVYSWRLSTDLKADLEREARRRKTTLSSVLDMAAREWLEKRVAEDLEEQARLHRGANKYIGCLDLEPPCTSENVRQVVRERLRARHNATLPG